MATELWDVIIIGAGPSGYTAAIYTGRASLKTLLLAGESAGGQLILTTEVENFPGFKEGIMGPALMEEMRSQAERFGTKIVNENVTRVDLAGEIKKIYVGEQEYQARSVVVATGAKAKMLNIGEQRLLGRGVSTCAVCDAAFYRERDVFVVGGGDAAMEDALALTKFAKSVTLIHRRDSFRASRIMQDRVLNNPKVKVMWCCEVVEVIGENRLEAIKVKNSDSGEAQELKADGLFLAIGHTPSTEIFDSSLELDEHGFLVTELTSGKSNSCKSVWLSGYPTQTSVKGVFGAGDVVDFRYKQAITAAAMGCQAALDTEKYLTGSFGTY